MAILSWLIAKLVSAPAANQIPSKRNRSEVPSFWSLCHPHGKGLVRGRWGVWVPPASGPGSSVPPSCLVSARIRNLYQSTELYSAFPLQNILTDGLHVPGVPGCQALVSSAYQCELAVFGPKYAPTTCSPLFYTV